MIRSGFLAASAVALLTTAQPVFAQTAPAPAPAAQQLSASHLAIAREVAIASGMTRSIDAMAEPMLSQLQQMNVTRPEISRDLAEVVNVIRPEIEKQKEQVVVAAARAFAERLSEPELNAIATFYKSPAGVKYVDTQPLILDEIVRQLADWTQNMSEYIIVRARAEMAKRGHQLQ
jgi:hypothetical protein